jgi:nucleotide-binding universal stress UspA family protein
MCDGGSFQMPSKFDEKNSASIRLSARCIGFAVNSSEGSQRAWAWSVANLLLPTDAIVLINVWGSEQPLGLRARTCGLACREASQGILHRFQARCRRRGLRCTAVSMEGGLAPCIAEAVRAHACDFLVMGSCNLGQTARALACAVGDRVTAMCSCPVLVVRKRADDAGAFLRSLPRRIFVKVRTPRLHFRPGRRPPALPCVCVSPAHRLKGIARQHGMASRWFHRVYALPAPQVDQTFESLCAFEWAAEVSPGSHGTLVQSLGGRQGTGDRETVRGGQR